MDLQNKSDINWMINVYVFALLYSAIPGPEKTKSFGPNFLGLDLIFKQNICLINFFLGLLKIGLEPRGQMTRENRPEDGPVCSSNSD